MGGEKQSANSKRAGRLVDRLTGGDKTFWHFPTSAPP